MRKLNLLLFVGGIVTAFYFFFIELFIWTSEPKTPTGDGHYIVFFPHHADPTYRLHGVMVGLVFAALGACGQYANRNRQQPATYARLGLTAFLAGSVAVGGFIVRQTQFMLMPDLVAQQYFHLRDQIVHEGYGVGWPYSETNQSKRRSGIQVVLSTKNRGQDWNHASVWATTDRLYNQWNSALNNAGIYDGSAQVYINDNDYHWCILRSASGVDVRIGNPP